MRTHPLSVLCALGAAMLSTAAAAQQIATRPVDLHAPLPGVTYQGAVEVSRQWRDRLGDNVLLLTGTPCAANTHCANRETYGYHFVRAAGASAYTLLWRTTDGVYDCEFDLTDKVLPRSVSVTDLDGDGVAETSFMYRLACRSDVSPADLKLIMHEGAAKYAIRGTTDLTRQIGEYGRSTMRVDPSFNSAPARFRDFAVRLWRQFVVESPDAGG
jgi:hypothetical protein